MNKDIKEITNYAESIKDDMELLYERIRELESAEEGKDPLKFLRNEDLRMYLYKLLGERGLSSLKKAIRNNKPIVVSGAEYTTGKTTLKNVLKYMGCNVIESIDAHEIKLNNLITEPIENLKELLFAEIDGHWSDFYEENADFITDGIEFNAIYNRYLVFCRDKKIKPLWQSDFYKKMHRLYSVEIVIKRNSKGVKEILVKKDKGEANGAGKEL